MFTSILQQTHTDNSPSKKVYLYCWLSLFLILTSGLWITTAVKAAKPLEYDLAISFDLSDHLLTGTAKITIPSEEPVVLHLDGLEVTAILIEEAGSAVKSIRLDQGTALSLPATELEKHLFISYKKQIINSFTNRIEDDGITLVGGWYPYPQQKVKYRLSATLPKGFSAYSESDNFPLIRINDQVTAEVSKPLSSIHFVAAPYKTASLPVRAGLSIHALFFEEDEQLATTYLAKGADYIRRYEKEIGPFLYNHFVIAANRLPTGLGMPTFTLIGQQVLRLPFIVDTSLGHEILHSWFGNSIDVNLAEGNWCEGLTAYLADHAYSKDKREDIRYRKNQLLNYHSYINKSNNFPLSDFRWAGHSGKNNKAKRAVGYSKAMMLFHELNQLVGEENFSLAIKDFYKNYRDHEASWTDIRDLFQRVTKEDLTSFFNERLSRTELPDLQISDTSLTPTEQGSRLNFTVKQNSSEPYSLDLPIRVQSVESHEDFIKRIDSTTTQITIDLDYRPLSFSVDPDYSLMRTLSPYEQEPVFSRFLGSDKKLIIVKESEQDIYSPLLSLFKREGAEVIFDHEVTNKQLAEFDLLFLGIKHRSSRSIFANIDHPAAGFTLEVRNNPLNGDHIAVLISSESAKESKAVARRLSHYGRYSFLGFSKGKLKEKDIREAEMGLKQNLEQLPSGSSTVNNTGFDHLIEQLAENRVIYIGETHTSASDHLLQFRIIEALSKKTDNLAIGMEMFPVSSQQALDDYTLDNRLSEIEFLKSSKYFQVWNYDFRLFRDIFRLAKQKNIPVLGLNIDKSIVSEVFKSGHTDNLGPEVKRNLPEDRDLDMGGYTDRLGKIFSMHSSHAKGQTSGFIQAQALWDESMANHIVQYLKNYPESIIVVLAGSQHTRKDSGIPPRVARRIDANQAIVANLSTDNLPVNIREIADYFFFSPILELPRLGKMGIILEEDKSGEKPLVKIDTFTEQSKATESGLSKGDIFISINGQEIETIDDVKISMLDFYPGETVTVELLRADMNTKRYTAEVELIDPKPLGHP